ncbi:MAG: hypothetical protein IPJ68_04885 [Candidatus Moraniibacteriota bacterium]|nr:MAG: hypothetical protein IPJ68_04885 [Candidatus Moranbacteria bacterium]
MHLLWFLFCEKECKMNAQEGDLSGLDLPVVALDGEWLSPLEIINRRLCVDDSGVTNPNLRTQPSTRWQAHRADSKKNV